MRLIENLKIVKLSNLDDEYKAKAVKLFVDGFYKIFSFSKDKKILQELFLHSLDFSMIYVALFENNVVGFLGIGNNIKRPTCFDKSICQKLLGKGKGYIVHKQMSYIMEKPTVKGERDVYIDYLTTNKKYRGKGIATKLINSYSMNLILRSAILKFYLKIKVLKDYMRKLDLKNIKEYIILL